jgi:NAD+-dependent secondary alcohol dehydrogenase Adh1
VVLAAEGQVRLHTTRYPLESFHDALAGLNQGRLRGRAILVPSGA